MTAESVNESSPIVEESMANIGATIMGRNMFGGHPGPWDETKPWNGWWGANPPFHHPVFVLTHHARAPLELEGGTSFTFVTGGIKAALDQARRAAAGKDVSLAGGARAARQYLVAGMVDEMDINLVPVLLGRGERLFDGVGDDLHGLELVRTVAAPGDAPEVREGLRIPAGLNMFGTRVPQKGTFRGIRGYVARRDGGGPCHLGSLPAAWGFNCR